MASRGASISQLVNDQPAKMLMILIEIIESAQKTAEVGIMHAPYRPRLFICVVFYAGIGDSSCTQGYWRFQVDNNSCRGEGCLQLDAETRP